MVINDMDNPAFVAASWFAQIKDFGVPVFSVIFIGGFFFGYIVGFISLMFGKK